MIKNVVYSCILFMDLDIINVLEFIVILRRNIKLVFFYLVSYVINILLVGWINIIIK